MVHHLAVEVVVQAVSQLWLSRHTMIAVKASQVKVCSGSPAVVSWHALCVSCVKVGIVCLV